MLKDQRIDTIMELLRHHKYLSVHFLVNQLHYSPATVRRDICRLEKMGYAKKSYGGICLNEHAKPLIIREHELTNEKGLLCREAAKLINDHETIFIAGSSTTYHLSKFLPEKKDITVVTTDMKLALYLEKMGVRCYCTGGLIRDGMLIGHLAIETLRQMNYDTCFFSVSGISDDGELTVASEEFGNLLKEVWKRSCRSICLGDESKLKKRSFYSIGNLQNVSHIISNGKFDKAIIKKFNTTTFIQANS